MAYITVSPNPVPIDDPAIGAYPHGVWDVQDQYQEWRLCEVVVSINGAPSIPFQGPGVFGRFVYPVNIPNTYEFILRYADTKSEITRVEVQTVRRHADIVGEYSADTPTTVSSRGEPTGGAGGGSGFENAIFSIDVDGHLEFHGDEELPTKPAKR
jgi:hypothetical protein